MSAEGLSLIGALGLEAIRKAGWPVESVGGMTMGADPVAYAIAAASWAAPPALDAFSVRREAKGHGMKRRVEGNFRSGVRVAVVEDVITTGNSTLEAIAAINEAGGKVGGVLVVVDREQGGREKIEAQDIQVVSLTTTSRLGLRTD